MADERFDLIVIGAGINGAGIARDATMRGLHVLLLDKVDIAAGTTAWSTRLIHGGLRYLEHGEVGLVRESLRERERLLRIARHLVAPLPLLIPIYAGDRRGPLLIRAGMVAYDLLSFDKSLPAHRMLSRDDALDRAPGLAPKDLRGAALYYDAQVPFAERLAVENAIDAVERGCELRLRTRVDRLVVEEGRGAGVETEDVVTGERRIARAPVVVNVGGPWVDRVLGGAQPRLIGGTKGSHIVVAPFPAAPADALYVEAKRDGRPYFVVPWNGQVLIGTTDSRYEGDLDWVVADDEEIDYLLAETNRVLPRAALGRGDVLSSYAGVRPLPYREGGAAGAITRRHVVRDHGADGGPGGLLSVVGGKLTTFRELAEQATDAVFRLQGRTPPPCATAEEPLPGARGSGTNSGSFDALPAASADHLRRVYGARAADVAALAADDPGLLESIDPDSGAIGAEVVWSVRREGASTLADILLRRTMVGLGPAVGVGADAAAAAVAVRALGWSEERAAAEVAEYRRTIARYRPRALEAVGSTGSRSGGIAAGAERP